MDRHQHFFIDKMETINTCGNEVIYFEGSSLEKQFEIKYFPNEKHNMDTCEGCKNSHKFIIQQMVDYYQEFPFCCEHHSKLAKKSWFNKFDYKDLPKMVADKVLFTHHHIINKLDEDDWKEDLTNYIEYGVESFGQFPLGCGEPVALSKYLRYIVELQEKFNLEGENRKYIDRQKFIINFIKNYGKPLKKSNTDFNLLLSTYDNWYRNFPFDIALFSNLKNHFSKQIPITSEKPKLNPYLGISKIKIMSQDELLDYLMTITKQILATIDTTKLLENEYITDTAKYQFDLKKKTHSLKQDTLLKQYSKGEKRYIKTIKKWLTNEKEFMQGIQSDLKLLPPIITDEKPINNKSFKYKKYNEGFSQLTDLMNALKKRDFIAEDTELSNFRKIFSGDEIQYKIVWIGNISELSYFVKQLHNELKYVENLKQKQWKVAANSFIQQNGDLYDRTKLRTQKVPSTSKSIDSALKTLK